MGFQVITSFEHYKSIIDENRLVTIDAWAPWCGPCRTISPIFESMSNDPQYHQIRFYKVDVDEQPEISQELGVRAMPSFYFFARGEKKFELVGANPSRLAQSVQQLAVM